MARSTLKRIQYQNAWYCPECVKSSSFHEMCRDALAHVTIERLETAMREAIRRIHEEPVSLEAIAQLLREALNPWEAFPKEPK